MLALSFWMSVKTVLSLGVPLLLSVKTPCAVFCKLIAPVERTLIVSELLPLTSAA